MNPTRQEQVTGQDKSGLVIDLAASVLVLMLQRALQRPLSAEEQQRALVALDALRGQQ